MTEALRPSVDVDALLDDRPQDGIFRVHRDAFTSPEVFALEMDALFERGWVFVGLASELPRPNDYKTVNVSRYPLLLSRGADRVLRCFINSCRHRGMVLAPRQQGNERYHTCRYHGWVYDSSGQCKEVTQQQEACYPPSFCEQRTDLEPVAAFADYRGFLFASLSPEVPSIEEHLGDARRFLDLALDKAAQGLEFVPGVARYTFEANWKLQIENALDIYHFGYTHASYIDVLARRAEDQLKGQAPAGDQDVQGSFGFPGGHAVQWRSNARVTPALIERRKASYSDRLDAAGERWAGYGVNVTIFPNLQLVENVSSLILRVIRPLRADLTEMEVRCLAPVGEDAELREARIRDYEDFFGAGGLATPDDSVVYEQSQRGLQASTGDWTLGYLRGMDRSGLPPVNRYAQELGIAPEDWSVGTRGVGDESRFHGAYRSWKQRLKAVALRRAAPASPVFAPAAVRSAAAGTAPAAAAAPLQEVAIAITPWQSVAPAASLADGRPQRVLVGGTALALVRVGEQIHALDDRCTHGAASLSDGEVHGSEIECPFHGGRFDLATGAATGLPCKRPVQVFPVRVREGRVEVSLARPEPAAAGGGLLELQIASRQMVATDILALELKDPSGQALPAFTAGAHVDLQLPSGLVRSYSLCNDPQDRRTYRLGVQLGRPSAGGSAEVHGALQEGSRIVLGVPSNDFELDEQAQHSLLVAGGIGVTPMVAMAYRLAAIGKPFSLHYTCRSRDRVAFRSELTQSLGSRLKVYLDEEPASRFDAAAVLRDAPRSATLYVCGPAGFVAHVEAVARELGWDPARVRKESFGAPAKDGGTGIASGG
jgi:benzoate/toluate 1,2-dioxygenase alpha subunit/2,4,5-trichlorophenoxyacetic acid oxygenase 1